MDTQGRLLRIKALLIAELVLNGTYAAIFRRTRNEVDTEIAALAMSQVGRAWWTWTAFFV
jgi:hypothetical protein